MEIQAELLLLQTLGNRELLAIAQSQINPKQQQRHIELLEKNQTQGGLTLTERQELNERRIAADRLMLQKAYAWSVLRWRGHKAILLG